MSKTKTLVVNATGNLTQPPVIKITAANLKDLFCNYSYDLVAGTGEGDSINRKGSAIVHDDLKNAFKKLDVHLAVICEEIDPGEITDVEVLEKIDINEEYEPGSIEEKVCKYRVFGFKCGDGGEGNVVLEGIKILSTGDHVSLRTPREDWDGGYAFLGELRVCIDDAIVEVEQYMNGKAAPKLEQTEMEFGAEENED